MDSKQKNVHGTEESKNQDLSVRVSICELEIKNLKYQLHYLCKPVVDLKKPSSVKDIAMSELVKAGQKGLGDKFISKMKKLIKLNNVPFLF